MDIQNIISRLDFSGLNAIEIQKAMNNMEFTADSILSGISSLGNIMFWVSANDDYSDFREDSANIGLMIKQITLIARTLTEQVNDLDCKARLAPLRNQKPDEQRNEIIGVIGDINNAELSIQQLKSDLYENEPEKEIIFAQLDLVASKLSGSLDQLEKMTGNNHG
ncbi:hypothetical protein ACGABU_002739 [Morganella morganii]|uniref:Uncharacterized protein n=1 Tax=Morganella morganii TaxID=582 RepID=A0AAE4JP42_MORMO|nr:hypothetical protein [Morganella morganii]EJD6038254.1 hypothetical protein [Morganella morganii]MDS0898451.1 hypothetical protein [Morganella morganii]